MLTYDILTDLPKHEIKKKIQHVAIYPRRSRASEKLRTAEDIEKELLHQSKLLKQICTDNDWTYTDYTEIGSGENIEDRPKMKQLLEDANKGLFSAIVCTKYDRLSRGSGSDQDKILLTLRANNIVVVESGGEILNPFNRGDLDKIRLYGMMANYEYSNIVERTTSAKRVRASEGNWVASSPPFGYMRNRKTKKLEINEKDAQVLREMIIEPYLKGKTSSEIALSLNQAKIPSPRGGTWVASVILSMLKNEVYTGVIIYNKTIGSRNRRESVNRVPYRKQPREKWIRTKEVVHEPIMSVDEFERIQRIMKNNAGGFGDKSPHPLSKLVKCFSCGKSLQIQKEKDKHIFKKCSCGATRGGDVSVVTDIVNTALEVLKVKLQTIDDSEQSLREKQLIVDEITKLESKLHNELKAIDRIKESVLYGLLDMKEGVQKKEELSSVVSSIEEQIAKKKEELNSFSVISNNEKVDIIDEFLSQIDNAENTVRVRELYLTMIESVIWKRTTENDLEISINFL